MQSLFQFNKTQFNNANIDVKKGVNSFTLTNKDDFWIDGVYFVKLEVNNKTSVIKILKTNN
jgi:hypothetical protein